MRPDASRTDRLLLVLAAGWALLWIAASSMSGDWLPGLLGLSPAAILLVAPVGIALLIPSAVGAIAALYGWVSERKRLRAASVLPVAVLLVVYFLGREIPSRPATVFYRHRDALIELVDTSVTEFRSAGAHELRLPDSALYESGLVYESSESSALVIEIIVGDFYMPLVYVSTDDPEDVLDTCSRGGIPVERLEPNWYVCRRGP